MSQVQSNNFIILSSGSVSFSQNEPKKKITNVCPLFHCHQWMESWTKTSFFSPKINNDVFCWLQKKSGSILRLMLTVWFWWNHNKKKGFNIQYRYEWIKMNEWKSIINSVWKRKNWISNRIVFFWHKINIRLKVTKKKDFFGIFSFQKCTKKMTGEEEFDSWWVPWNVAFQNSTIYSLSSFRRMNWMAFDFFSKYYIESKFGRHNTIICHT